jgi:hypothetical protein
MPDSGLLLTAIGAASMGISTWLFSANWCCTPIGMGIVGAVVSIFEQAVAGTAWASRYRQRVALRAACTAVFGIAVGLLFLLDRPHLFEIVFGMPPPPELRDLHIRRYHALGPNDNVILMRFTADRSTIDQIRSARIFRSKPDLTESYPDQKTWQELWGRAIGDFARTFGGKEWESVLPMNSPKAYATDIEDDRHTIILWDEATGRTYVLSTKG